MALILSRGGSRHARLTSLCAASVFAVCAALPASVLAQAAAAVPSAGKSMKVGAGVYEVAVSPSTGTIYVASAGSRDVPGAAVVALDGNTLDIKSRVDVSAAVAYGLGINDRTQTLYTTNTRGASVSAIDLKTGKIVATIKSDVDTNAHLREVVVDEAANMAYASSFGQQGKVWVIDGRTNTVTALIDTGNGTSGLVVDSAAKRLYATNIAAGEVLAIDLTNRQVVQRFPAGGERPTNIALDATTGRLYVANQGTANVTVLDSKTGALVATVPAGQGALDVEVNPAAKLGYVANRGAGTVTVFNLATNAVVTTLQTGSAPNTLAVDGKSGLVYVTNKARPAPRGGGRGQGQAAPAAPPAPPAEDPGGDTVTVIRP